MRRLAHLALAAREPAAPDRAPQAAAAVVSRRKVLTGAVQVVVAVAVGCRKGVRVQVVVVEEAGQDWGSLQEDWCCFQP